jgi:hypothetical protein
VVLVDIEQEELALEVIVHQDMDLVHLEEMH